MAKYSKKNLGKFTPSASTVESADLIAKGTKKEGQNKQRTKLIAQGIQKGIDQYKKQQKSKNKDLVNKNKVRRREQKDQIQEQVATVQYKQHWLPWTLLLISWLGIAAYFLLGR